MEPRGNIITHSRPEKNTPSQPSQSQQNLPQPNQETTTFPQTVEQTTPPTKSSHKLLFIIILLGLLAIIATSVFLLIISKPTEQNNKKYLMSYFIGTDFNYNNIDTQLLTTYSEYRSLLKYTNLEDNNILTEADFDENDFVFFTHLNSGCAEATFNGIRDIKATSSQISIEVGYDEGCGGCASSISFILVPIEKNIANKNTKIVITKKQENDPQCGNRMGYSEKPIIYLYPESEIAINVKLGKPEILTTTYPEYNQETGWQVIASPNGNLQLGDKNYYGLYWEGINTSIKNQNEGFIVSGSETAKFLENKLAILGLNDYEIEEFIIYWLPRMQNNEYNHIYFATEQEIEENMPLNISPKPDTTIRIFMVVKPLETYREIKEQTLTPKTRNGYTVIEWGGSIENHSHS